MTNKPIIGLLLLVLPALSWGRGISKRPVADEQVVKHDLFQLDTLDIRYYFRANLPENNFLTMEFEKLSYWPANGIGQVFSTAVSTVSGLRDSFAKPGTSKRIDIYVPYNNEPTLVRYTEHPDNGNLVLMKGGGNTPLKIGMDTIRIMKVYTDTTGMKHTIPARIQYTFILKDLEQVNTLNSRYVIDSVQGVFDAQVATKRKAWGRQDVWHHSMDAVYDMNGAEPRVQAQASKGLLKRFDISADLGMSLFRNSLAPNGDIGLSYKWLKKNKNYSFAELSFSNISFFDLDNLFGLQASNVLFMNMETGTLFSKKNSLVPMYKTSIGFGIKVSNDFAYTIMGGDFYVLFQGPGYRLFAKYSLSRAITVMPDLYFFGRTIGQRYMSNSARFVGITVYFKLF